MKNYTLKELLDDHQTGHSELQDDYFITIKAGGTIYGQYKQALRELYRRVRGLRELSCDYEKLKIEIEQKKFIANQKRSFTASLAMVEQKRKTMQLEEAERAIKDTKREAIRFYQQACQLKSKLGKITPEKRLKLDREMWLHKAREMAALDLLANGRITGGSLEMICSLPFDLKHQVIKEMKEGQKKLVGWYEMRTDDFKFSDISKLSDTKILKELEM